MKNWNLIRLAFVSLALLCVYSACTSTDNKTGSKEEPIILKGLYSFGPEIKAFTTCEDVHEYWVIDSADNLESAYLDLGFEKPYTPVYIEVEGHLKKSDTTQVNADYDSTLVVTKVLKITKEIPEGPCRQ